MFAHNRPPKVRRIWRILSDSPGAKSDLYTTALFKEILIRNFFNLQKLTETEN